MPYTDWDSCMENAIEELEEVKNRLVQLRLNKNLESLIDHIEDGERLEALPSINWISVKDKPIVTVITSDNKWEENENTPQDIFLAAVELSNGEFDKFIAIITDFGLKGFAEGEEYNCGWNATDITHYSLINDPL